MPKLIIKADQAGNVKIEAEDFQGVGCQDATKAFEEAYASKKRSEELRPEYWESASDSAGTEKLRF